MAVKTIAMGGARDGLGKSVLTVNLALSLLKETRSRILVMDIDSESCGDLSILLGVKPARTIHGLIPYIDQLTTEAMSRQITLHPTGMGFLPLGENPKEARKVEPAVFVKILDLVKPLCDYIVLDCGVGLNPIGIHAMERSTAIFLLSVPDILILNHTRRLLEELQELHFPARSISVLLNRVEDNKLTNEIIFQKLNRNILARFPQDTVATQQALMTGRPFVADQPRALITKACDEFTRLLIEQQILDKMESAEKAGGIQVDKGRVRGLDEASSRQADQISQWMKARGTKSRLGVKEIDARTAVKMVIHKRLVEVLDLKKLNKESQGNEERDAALRKQAYQAVVKLIDQEGQAITDRHERELIVKEILDEALGLGPLEEFLANDTITEIMVNRRDQIYIERKGKLELADAKFTDDAQLMGVIERIVQPLGRRIDEKSPMVDARLADGSRVNAIIPPLAIDGPSITIRKFSRDPLKVSDLIKFGSMTEEMADLLRTCVQAKLNIIISGGTGSGKTTLLNVLSSFIPSNERIVTIEDSAELQLKQPHIVRLESRPPNIEGEGEIAIRDLVKNSLRMRPDRIVVGECRGAESLDMLQAMNTGHDGSITTIHANTPRDCISRLETLVMFAGLDLPSKAIREQIASAIHIIIQQARMTDGTRKIIQVSEITGMEGQVITLQDIFVFKQQGLDENRKVIGRYVATGFVPKFVTKLEALGIPLPRGIFAAAPPTNDPYRRR